MPDWLTNSTLTVVIVVSQFFALFWFDVLFENRKTREFVDRVRVLGEG